MRVICFLFLVTVKEKISWFVVMILASRTRLLLSENRERMKIPPKSQTFSPTEVWVMVLKAFEVFLPENPLECLFWHAGKSPVFPSMPASPLSSFEVTWKIHPAREAEEDAQAFRGYGEHQEAVGRLRLLFLLRPRWGIWRWWSYTWTGVGGRPPFAPPCAI